MALDFFDLDDKIQIFGALIVQVLLLIVTPTKVISNFYVGLALLIILYFGFKFVLVRLYMTGSKKAGNTELAESTAKQHLRFSLGACLAVSLILGGVLGSYGVDGINTLFNYMNSIAFTAFVVSFPAAVVADMKDALNEK